MRDRPIPLHRFRDRELTLEALADATARLLRQLRLRPDEGRVAEAADARGIRYYQTIGVVDRPLRYEGRRAVYGYRHLIQLLCVKKLQQEGHPLQLIQQGLAGRTTESLEQALAASTAPAATSCEEPETGRSGRLVAAQVAPGVTVTIDPAVVDDPEAVLAAIEESVRRASGRGGN